MSLSAVDVHVDVTVPEAFEGLLEPARHKAFSGGRGSAKSHTFGEVLVAKAHIEQLRIVCARQFQTSIRESVKELLEQKIFKFGLYENFKITETEIVSRATASKFIFIGLDRNPNSAKSLEGADIAWVEEAQTINQRSMDILIPTVRKPGSELWWAWNPDKPEDPVDDYFRGGKPPPRSIIRHVTYRDNPLFYETELVQEMRFMRERDPPKYRHIWLGEYDKLVDAAVFKRWTIGRMDVPDSAIPRFGMDFGFGSDPTAFIKVYFFPANRKIYIAAEAGGHGIPTEDLPDLMDQVAEAKRYVTTADSSRPDTIDYLMRRGFPMAKSVKGTHSVKDGIEWLKGFDIVVAPECLQTINELKNYSWEVDKRSNPPIILPVLGDDYNHYIDALRYALEADRRAMTGLIKKPQWR